MKSPVTGLVPEAPCILLVEDDDPVRRSLQLLLRGRGFDVRAYASSSQALADPLNRSAVCLIADLVMPELDGIDLLGGLRADGWTGRAILVSGYLTAEKRKRAEEAGFDAVLAKPVAENVLMSVLASLSSQPSTTSSKRSPG